MKRSVLAALVHVATVVSASGCGTAANLCWLPREEGGKRIYGGVIHDADMAGKDFEAAPDSHNYTRTRLGETTEEALGFYGRLLDLPLSLIADTITLPITIPLELWAERKAAPPESTRIQVPLSKPGSPPT